MVLKRIFRKFFRPSARDDSESCIQGMCPHRRCAVTGVYVCTLLNEEYT